MTAQGIAVSKGTWCCYASSIFTGQTCFQKLQAKDRNMPQGLILGRKKNKKKKVSDGSELGLGGSSRLRSGQAGFKSKYRPSSRPNQRLS